MSELTQIFHIWSWCRPQRGQKRPRVKNTLNKLSFFSRLMQDCDLSLCWVRSLYFKYGFLCQPGESLAVPQSRGPAGLEAISWSLILIRHSAALNTRRQIPADTRGPGDRKQLGVCFWENLQTIPTSHDKKKKKRGKLGEFVPARGNIPGVKKEALWPSASLLGEVFDTQDGKNSIYSSSWLCREEGKNNIQTLSQCVSLPRLIRPHWSCCLVHNTFNMFYISKVKISMQQTVKGAHFSKPHALNCVLFAP